jgi:DNA-binding NarL/FixJ family response regulator
VSNRSSYDPARAPIGVFVLDDQEIVRRGVRSLLEAEPDIRVIGEAGTASAALASIPASRPDVAVLDVRLPDGDGVSVCREVRSRAPEVACLMFTAFSDDQALLDSILAGAAGYLLKQVRGSDLVGEGLTNRQIGERLFIAEKTVKNYASMLFRKLGLTQRTAAAAYAARTFNGRTVEPHQNMWSIDRHPGT